MSTNDDKTYPYGIPKRLPRKLAILNATIAQYCQNPNRTNAEVVRHARASAAKTIRSAKSLGLDDPTNAFYCLMPEMISQWEDLQNQALPALQVFLDEEASAAARHRQNRVRHGQRNPRQDRYNDRRWRR